MSSKDNLTVLLELLRRDADTDDLIAELRDGFIDIEYMSDLNGRDILPEVASDPKSVLYYVAQYIEALKKEAGK